MSDKTTIQVNINRGKKPFARLVLKTDKGVNLVVTVDKDDQHGVALEEGLRLLYGALLRFPPDQARDLYNEVISKLDKQ
jgi:hypothetical protein